jgi:murein DD-endopeptidase MepM/ murein hydrolase activator NlpD
MMLLVLGSIFASSAYGSAEEEQKGRELMKNMDFIGDMEELAAIYEFVGRLAIARGETILCPVEIAEFTSSFGASRVGHSHQGVDMMAPDGTPIVAPESGIYEQHGSESFYLYGNSGTMYFGTHLQEQVAPSGNVEVGELVALVGHTGNASASGPHLHFEIHPHGGDAVDPYPITSNACF